MFISISKNFVDYSSLYNNNYKAHFYNYILIKFIKNRSKQSTHASRA